MNPNRAAGMLLALILLVAIVLRIQNIDFGLPSLWDDDEPFFLMFGLKLLKNQTLNPGWFGHPGTITIYLLAAVAALVYGIGMLLGGWSNVPQFLAAVYANPALLMIPERLTVVIPGVLSVYVTYRIATRLVSRPAGLLAAMILALSPLHINLSQVIRTDVQMTLFLLLTVNAALPLLENYRPRSLIWSAVFAGLACATKWPGMVAVLVPMTLAIRSAPSVASGLRRAGMSAAIAVTALLVASPFILLDYQTVLNNVILEGRPQHLSQTSHGLIPTLSYYLLTVIPAGVTWPVWALSIAGLTLALGRSWRDRIGPTIVMPLLTFLALISAQHIQWARWAVPLIPFVAILAALGVDSAAHWLAKRTSTPAPALRMGLSAALAVPLLLSAMAGARERSHDTRDAALQWIATHAEPDASVSVETPALALLSGPWQLRFPLGDLGCIDPRAAMAGGVDYDDVAQATKGRININLGTVPSNRIASCRADFIIVNELDRYAAEASRYPAEMAAYRQLLTGMSQIATFAPAPGRTSGPIVRIFASPAGRRVARRPNFPLD